MKPPVRLLDLTRCFQGVVPCIIATSDAGGVPNVTYISQVYYVDDRHVALSCQFFNKTRRNLDENPYACVEMNDPLTMEAYRLHLKFLRSEKSGPLFDVMSLRIDAIASHTGMTGIFKLIAADVFEVLSLDPVEGFHAEAIAPAHTSDGPSLVGARTEVRGLQWVSERVNQARDLETILRVVLEALEEYFHFSHTLVLLLDDESTGRLVTLASRGYGGTGIGAEVAIGDGVIGTAARGRRILRLTTLDGDLRYGRAIRREAASAGRGTTFEAEIPLPGLPDAQSVLAIPLIVGERLVGVLAAEDRDAMQFNEWHEAYLEIIGNQIALAIARMLDRPEESSEAAGAGTPAPQPAPQPMPAPRPSPLPAPSAAGGRTRRLTYYRRDDAIFVDDEYLIRNVPAKILWKVLGESMRSGRTEFSNREMRLDPSLGLPAIRDNLESRLILLRHRLREKCPDLQLVSTGRGRFALRSTGGIEMIER